MLVEFFAVDVELVELLVGRFVDGLAHRLPVFDVGGVLVVVALGVFELAADVGHVADAHLLALPLLAEAGELALELAHLFVDFGEAFLGVFLGFVLELAGGEFELHQAALHLVDLGRHAFEFHGEAAGGFVHQVDRLVGEEAVGDVAVRELGGGDEGGVFDPHALVMGFVAGLEAAEDGDRVFDVRLADEDGLEAALEGGVLFDVLAVFVESGRADAAELAAGEGGLEQVGRVAPPFGRAGADTVWSSSMNRITLPASWTSFSRALRRSSNSPRNLVPAMSAPMSSAITRLFLRLCGTSAWTMRSASPSAMAVLPTPGSPISTGLFLVRRERTWITRRISWSRPITGSSLPWPARSTRSMPYFSRAWNLPSGAWSVTRAEPRTARSEPRIASLVIALSFSTSWAFDLVPASARSRCSVETNSSFMPSASAWAASSTLASAGLAPVSRAAAGLGQMLELGVDDLFELSWCWRRSCRARGGRCRRLRPSSAAEQMDRLDLGIARLGRELLRAATASWALMVSLSKRNGMDSSQLSLE